MLQYSKFVLQPALTLASDKRPVMKASLMAMLDAWVAHNEISVAPCVEKVLHALPEPLANPNGRTELLEWAARHVDAALSVTQETPLSPASLSALVPTVVSCLLSKDSASRTASQKLLGCIIRVCGRAGVDKAAKDLKPAEQRSVNDMITAAATAALLVRFLLLNMLMFSWTAVTYGGGSLLTSRVPPVEVEVCRQRCQRSLLRRSRRLFRHQ
jgi:hypothetical protein